MRISTANKRKKRRERWRVEFARTMRDYSLTFETMIAFGAFGSSEEEDV